MTMVLNPQIPIITVGGDTWQVLSTGRYAEGMVFVHLASTTQFVEQRNGRRPVQLTIQLSAELVERTLGRPRGFFTWNRSLRGAFERGERAHTEGHSIHDCPYPDKRKDNGRLTWSRGYRTAWVDGFKLAAQRSPE